MIVKCDRLVSAIYCIIWLKRVHRCVNFIDVASKIAVFNDMNFKREKYKVHNVRLQDQNQSKS